MTLEKLAREGVRFISFGRDPHAFKVEDNTLFHRSHQGDIYRVLQKDWRDYVEKPKVELRTYHPKV